MAALVGALRVTLGANTAQYEAGMRRAQATARRTGTDISRSLDQARRTTVIAFRAMAGAAATFGLAQGVRAIMGYIDAAKQLEAQLRLATRESGNFAQAQSDVRRIAAETRSGIEETANLYAAFQRNARELGITQEQAARATQTVSEAFQISGATAAEAAGGLRQFLQGIQSGTLRGEELNSVLENAPRLARLLADALGVTIGQLRAMGAEGELTADKLIRALTDRRFTAGIDAEFRELPITFDQAMTQVHNAAVVAFGAFDRGGQFSQALVNFAGQGAISFEEIERYAFETGQEIRAIMSGLANVFEPMGMGASNVFEFIRNEAIGLRRGLEDILGSWDWLAQGLRSATMYGIAGVTGTPMPVLDQALPQATPVLPRFQAGRGRGGLLGMVDDAMARAQSLIPRTSSPARRPAPPRIRLGGGGGGGRRRIGGGGGGRRRSSGTRVSSTPLVDIPFEDSMSAFTSNFGPTADEIFEREIAPLMRSADEIAERLRNSVIPAEDLSLILHDLPSIPDRILPEDDQRRLEQFAHGFTRDLADGLASAIVYGEDLGDVLISTIQRAAAELISSSLVQLLTGGSFGGKGGAGGVADFVTSAIGSVFGGHRASGGPVLPGRSYIVGERGPEMLHVGGRGGFVSPNSGAITIHQHYRFEGVAITQEQFVAGLAFAKQDTISAIRNQNRRAG